MSAPMTPEEARAMAQWGGPLFRSRLIMTMRCAVPRKPDDPDPILEALSRSAMVGSFTPLLPANAAIPRADPTGGDSDVVSFFIPGE